MPTRSSRAKGCRRRGTWRESGATASAGTKCAPPKTRSRSCSSRPAALPIASAGTTRTGRCSAAGSKAAGSSAWCRSAQRSSRSRTASTARRRPANSRSKAGCPTTGTRSPGGTRSFRSARAARRQECRSAPGGAAESALWACSERLAQIRDKPVALGGFPHRLNVSGAGNDPQLLRFQRRIVELPRMMDRHRRVPVSVENQQRDRADRLYHGQRAETVVHGERRDPLERPGEPVVGEFFTGDLDVAGERALYDEGADAIAKRRVCDVVHRERAAQALAVDDDAVLVYVLAREQRFHRGVNVFLRALQVGLAFGCAVAAVVENEHVETARGHPGNAGEVSADVLRVAVQMQDRAERAAFRGQEPAVELDSVVR